MKELEKQQMKRLLDEQYRDLKILQINLKLLDMKIKNSKFKKTKRKLILK